MKNKFHVHCGIGRNKKIIRLVSLMGYEGFYFLVMLWCWITENSPRGTFGSMTETEIEAAVSWPGVPGQLVNRLISLGFLKVSNGEIFVHAWKDWNSAVYFSKEKSDVARKNVLARWERNKNK